jgi:hypothetical protein
LLQFKELETGAASTQELLANSIPIFRIRTDNFFSIRCDIIELLVVIGKKQLGKKLIDGVPAPSINIYIPL